MPCLLFIFPRRLILLAALIAAVGVPYVATSGKDWRRWLPGRDGDDASLESTRVVSIEESLPPPNASIDLDSIFRFDVTPSWVTGRWPRVTTVLGNPQFHGLRVALVTGTKEQDLAGSLTYYFDREQRVQRIAFTGTTGDPQPLLAFLVRKFELREEPALGAGLLMSRWNGRPTSAVRLAHAPVIRRQSPESRVQVLMEINRPEHFYGLSPEYYEMLRRERLAEQW